MWQLLFFKFGKCFVGNVLLFMLVLLLVEYSDDVFGEGVLY